MENLLSAQDVAYELKIHVQTLRDYIREGRIEAYYIGGRHQFSRSQINDFLEKSKTTERLKEKEQPV